MIDLEYVLRKGWYGEDIVEKCIVLKFFLNEEYFI